MKEVKLSGKTSNSYYNFNDTNDNFSATANTSVTDNNLEYYCVKWITSKYNLISNPVTISQDKLPVYKMICTYTDDSDTQQSITLISTGKTKDSEIINVPNTTTSTTISVQLFSGATVETATNKTIDGLKADKDGSLNNPTLNEDFNNDIVSLSYNANTSFTETKTGSIIIDSEHGNLKFTLKINQSADTPNIILYDNTGSPIVNSHDIIMTKDIYSSASSVEKIYYAWFSESVTKIDNDAFSGCTNLKGVKMDLEIPTSKEAVVGINTVDIHKSIESIGSNAFKGCSNISSVTFSNDATITSVGNNAFDSCTKLSSFNIVDTITDFGTNVFNGDTGLTSVTFGTGLSACTAHNHCAQKTIISGANNVNTLDIYTPTVGDFSGKTHPLVNISSVTFETSVASMSAKCFDNSNVKVLKIEEGLEATAISDYAFNQCKNLQEIHIPHPIKTIGKRAFYQCIACTALTLPYAQTDSTHDEDKHTLQVIGASAFTQCSNISSVTIPDSVQIIKEYAFDDCTSNNKLVFDEVTIDSGLTIEDYAFHNNYHLANYNDTNEIQTPKLTASIGNYAFSNCWHAKGIQIKSADSMTTTIGHNAFEWCEQATALTIENVVSIDYDAFQFCFKIPELTIPESVSSITYNPWTYCPSLSSITVNENNTAFTSCIISDEETDNLNCIMYKSGYTLENDDLQDDVYIVKTGCKKTNIAEEIVVLDTESFKGNIHEINRINDTDLHGINRNPYTAHTNIYNLGTLSTTLTFPNSLLVVKNEAFYDCNKLQQINSSGEETIEGRLGNKLCEIHELAFAYTYELAKVILPNTLYDLKNFAFYHSNCSELHLSEYDDDLPSTSCSINNFGERHVFCYCGINTISGADTPHIYVNSDIVYEDSNKAKVILTSANGLRILSSLDNSYITNIGMCAGHGNSAITHTSLNLLSNLTGVSNYAFAECTANESISLPNKLVEIGINKENNGNIVRLNWRSPITYHTDYGYSWYNNTNYARNIEIPNNVTTIGNHSFDNCYNATSLTFTSPSSVSVICQYAFYNCYNLGDITIPQSVETIGMSAFYSCSKSNGDKTLKFECGKLTKIDSSAFSSSGFKTVEWGDLNGEKQLAINSSAFSSMAKLTGITIPEYVSQVGSSCFQSDSVLTSMTNNSSITALSTSCFAYCYKLETVILGNAIQLINTSCFSSCSNLTEITLPSTLTALGYSVFSSCSKLNTVNCYAITAPTIYDNTFSSVADSGTIHVKNDAQDYDNWITNPYLTNWTIKTDLG